MLCQHASRLVLHNEVHARPAETLDAPLALAHVVMVCDATQREASRGWVATLARDHHQPPPDAQTIHLRLDLGPFRLRWELHTEFVTWTFTRTLNHEQLSTADLPNATDVVPQAWLAELPGECLSSLHMWVLPNRTEGADTWVKHLLLEDALVASTVADGFGEVYTDFTVHADGFSRMLLFVGGMTPRRLGRLVQRLLEIETYRMAALLGLPAAREASQVLASAERELAQLAQSIRAASPDDEPELLDRLTKLAGNVESQHAATHSRFSASAAYFELIDKRISDIAESRLSGMQTIGEFMERRLSPARSTCAWSSRRQDALSQRVSRISNLLRTRVEIEQQQSSQAVLSAMNKRQDLQMQLQATVEGLSVAAITYYIAGLILYLAKGMQVMGWPLNPEVSAAISVPVVALLVWWMLRRLHRRVFKLDTKR